MTGSLTLSFSIFMAKVSASISIAIAKLVNIFDIDKFLCSECNECLHFYSFIHYVREQVSDIPRFSPQSLDFTEKASIFATRKEPI